MKKLVYSMFLGFTLMSAQVKEHTIWQPFKISVPSNLQKHFVLNPSVLAHFADDDNETHMIVIQTEKEKISEYNTIYESIVVASEDYTNLIFESLINDKKRKKFS